MHFQWQNGKGDLLVARQDKRPTYAQLVDILRKVLIACLPEYTQSPTLLLQTPCATNTVLHDCMQAILR